MPLITYYGVQKPACAATWPLIVYVVWLLALTVFSYVFFRLGNSKISVLWGLIIVALQITLVVVYSGSAQWWSGIIAGCVLLTMFVLQFFLFDIMINPFNTMLSKYDDNETYHDDETFTTHVVEI